jgi:hypothetical protein
VKIDRELFEEWLANPVTEHVLAKVRETAEANKALWMSISWDGGKADQQTLVELKARYEAGLDLSELKYEDVSDDESERDLSHGIQGADRAG